MSMPPLNRQVPETDPKLPDSTANTGVAGVVAVLNVRKQRMKVDTKRIKALAARLSTLAMEMGLTSSPESFADMLEEDFTAALKTVEKRQNSKKDQSGVK